MQIGFNLKYGNTFEEQPHWNQFVQLLNAAKGRKNLFIFRVLAAHIVEMGLDDADGFQMLSAIEGWANDRLSSRGFVQNRMVIPEKSPPANHVSMTPAGFDEYETAEKDHNRENSSVVANEPVTDTEPAGTMAGFDLSSFIGMK